VEGRGSDGGISRPALLLRLTPSHVYAVRQPKNNQSKLIINRKDF
jgi:hypothetical protein